MSRNPVTKVEQLRRIQALKLKAQTVLKSMGDNIHSLENLVYQLCQINPFEPDCYQASRFFSRPIQLQTQVFQSMKQSIAQLHDAEQALESQLAEAQGQRQGQTQPPPLTRQRRGLNLTTVSSPTQTQPPPQPQPPTLYQSPRQRRGPSPTTASLPTSSSRSRSTTKSGSMSPTKSKSPSSSVLSHVRQRRSRIRIKRR